MKIVWIIDNKFRELYGLYNLKEILKKNKIDLLLIHKFNWKSSINLFNPSLVVIPNLAETSCKPILDYCYKKRIKIFLHSSEGMYYQTWVQEDKYPINLVRKIEKVLVWSELDAKYLRSKKLGKKVFLTGNLKYDLSNYIQENKKKNNKIKVIGIPTPLRYLTSIWDTDILGSLKDAVEKNQKEKIGFIKIELEYLEMLFKLIPKLKKLNLEVVLKPHPFESQKIYRKAFPNIDIYNGQDVREFLKKVDIILNLHSSISVDAIKYNIPVISLNNLIKWSDEVLKLRARGPNSKTGASKLGLNPTSIDELINLILRNSKESLMKKCIKKKDDINSNKLATSLNSLDLFKKIFVKYLKLENKIKYVYFPKYIYAEMRQFFFKKKRIQLFAWWKLEDRKLLRIFKI